jgi:hypothetical protein
MNEIIESLATWGFAIIATLFLVFVFAIPWVIGVNTILGGL